MRHGSLHTCIRSAVVRNILSRGLEIFFRVERRTSGSKAVLFRKYTIIPYDYGKFHEPDFLNKEMRHGSLRTCIRSAVVRNILSRGLEIFSESNRGPQGQKPSFFASILLFTMTIENFINQTT